MSSFAAVVRGSESIINSTLESTESYATIQQLLVGLDTLSRSDHARIKTTISQVYEVCISNGVDPTKFLQFCILIAFKRRNHDKSRGNHC